MYIYRERERAFFCLFCFVCFCMSIIYIYIFIHIYIYIYISILRKEFTLVIFPWDLGASFGESYLYSLRPCIWLI